MAAACWKVAPGKLSTCTSSCWKGGRRERLESPMMTTFFLTDRPQSDSLCLMCTCLVGLHVGVPGDCSSARLLSSSLQVGVDGGEEGASMKIAPLLSSCGSSDDGKSR
ncbi:hypothetical protein OJAV_G00016270 [Oryzias javanicus]|uniref:Uncharacterized protein n=1 Tax=Oryzias javanicus TaxID=123683 RepID=A0A3S2Q0R6_ORYJA|nr:hypothetical protein OJAV_G00016270 [Oryzias javanicus]